MPQFKYISANREKVLAGTEGMVFPGKIINTLYKTPVAEMIVGDRGIDPVNN